MVSLIFPKNPHFLLAHDGVGEEPSLVASSMEPSLVVTYFRVVHTFVKKIAKDIVKDIVEDIVEEMAKNTIEDIV